MDNTALDSVIMGILNPILEFFSRILQFIFSSRLTTVLFALLFMNLIGFYLMKLDKKYAKENAQRIKESTLFMTAILFGSIGILAGMYTFHHKTLHKSFTIGIPLILAVQIVFIIYSAISGWMI